MQKILKSTLIGISLFAFYSFFFSGMVYLFEFTSSVFSQPSPSASLVLTVLISLPLFILSLPYVPIEMAAQHLGLQPFPQAHSTILAVNIPNLIITNIGFSLLGGILGFVFSSLLKNINRARKN